MRLETQWEPENQGPSQSLCGGETLKDFTQGNDTSTFNPHIHLCLHLTFVTKQYHLIYLNMCTHILVFMQFIYLKKWFFIFVVCLFSVLGIVVVSFISEIPFIPSYFFQRFHLLVIFSFFGSLETKIKSIFIFFVTF